MTGACPACIWGPGGPHRVSSSSQEWTQGGERGLGKDTPLARPLEIQGRRLRRPLRPWGRRAGSTGKKGEGGSFPERWARLPSCPKRRGQNQTGLHARGQRELRGHGVFGFTRLRLTGLTPAQQQVSAYQLRPARQPCFSDHLSRLGFPFDALLALRPSPSSGSHFSTFKIAPPCLSQVLFWVSCPNMCSWGTCRR